MIDQAQIASFFSVPELSDSQKTAYREVVEAARVFAEKVNENMLDGENYRCMLPAHGPKVKHGCWWRKL